MINVVEMVFIAEKMLENSADKQLILPLIEEYAATLLEIQIKQIHHTQLGILIVMARDQLNQADALMIAGAMKQ